MKWIHKTKKALITVGIINNMFMHTNILKKVKITGCHKCILAIN